MGVILQVIDKHFVQVDRIVLMTAHFPGVELGGRSYPYRPNKHWCYRNLSVREVTPGQDRKAKT